MRIYPKDTGYCCILKIGSEIGLRVFWSYTVIYMSNGEFATIRLNVTNSILQFKKISLKISFLLSLGKRILTALNSKGSFPHHQTEEQRWAQRCKDTFFNCLY